MNNQDIVSDSEHRSWQGWRLLSLRWLLGWMTGFGLSAWVCFGYITNTVAGPLLWLMDFLPVLIYLFSGPLLLFDPQFFGNEAVIQSLARHFPNVDYHFLIVALPSILWGFIGGLLASGRRNQVRIGFALLVVYVTLGCIALFEVFIHIPT